MHGGNTWKKERKNKKIWFDEECREVVEGKQWHGKTKDTRLNSTPRCAVYHNYKKLSNETMKTIRTKTRTWVNQLLEKAEQSHTVNNSKISIANTTVFQKKSTPPQPVK